MRSRSTPNSAKFSLAIENVPSENPKTGRITALSVIAALRKLQRAAAGGNLTTFMTYVPHTQRETSEMLAAIGVSRMEDLFADVPAALRFPKLDLPAALSELEIAREMRALARRNLDVDPSLSFLGAGVYRHFRPATVDDVLRRGEFYTSYTQYQPEASQGMLQALFEYQSMICRLTGMEVSNASHYDGATALAEAVLLALECRAGEAPQDHHVAGAVHPQYRAVVRTYLRGLADISGHRRRGRLTISIALQAADRRRHRGVRDPKSEFLRPMRTGRRLGRCGPPRRRARSIVVFDPIALGLFRPPAAYGADVVVAEGQSLGIPPSFGGPHLGIFATRMAHVRRMSGHLVGETVDQDGRRGYVLTLATREQHIRRAKATSNICTNSARLRARRRRLSRHHGQGRVCGSVAELCFHKSHYAAAEIGEASGLCGQSAGAARRSSRNSWCGCRGPSREVNRRLREEGIIGGYDLGSDYPHLANHMLIAVTEMNTRAGIDRLVAALGARRKMNEPHGGG